MTGVGASAARPRRSVGGWILRAALALISLAVIAMVPAFFVTPLGTFVEPVGVGIDLAALALLLAIARDALRR